MENNPCLHAGSVIMPPIIATDKTEQLMKMPAMFVNNQDVPGNVRNTRA